jgi:hypothetical protein
MNKKEITLGYVWPSHFSLGDDPWDDYHHKEYPEHVKKYPKEEVILPANKVYTLVIDYPLNKPFKGTFKTPSNGMNRQQFAELATKTYQMIYKIEEDQEGPTPNIPGMYNRQTSNGPFGIWGHDIGDLTIHTLYVDEVNAVIELGVDS